MNWYSLLHDGIMLHTVDHQSCRRIRGSEVGAGNSILRHANHPIYLGDSEPVKNPKGYVLVMRVEGRGKLTSGINAWNRIS